MRVVIFGSRTVFDFGLLCWVMTRAEAIVEIADITEAACGCAIGVDRMAGHDSGGRLLKDGDGGWASLAGIPVKHFPVTPEDWKRYGTRGPDNAAYRRNEQMADYCEAGIGLWRANSPGTGHMLGCLQRLGRPYHMEHL